MLYLYPAGFKVKCKFCITEKETLMKKEGAAYPVHVFGENCCSSLIGKHVE